jgi:hypothetical protein
VRPNLIIDQAFMKGRSPLFWLHFQLSPRSTGGRNTERVGRSSGSIPEAKRKRFGCATGSAGEQRAASFSKKTTIGEIALLPPEKNLQLASGPANREENRYACIAPKGVRQSAATSGRFAGRRIRGSAAPASRSQE